MMSLRDRVSIEKYSVFCANYYPNISYVYYDRLILLLHCVVGFDSVFKTEASLKNIYIYNKNHQKKSITTANHITIFELLTVEGKKRG